MQIFLTISGFLYGGKLISDDIAFYKRKLKQILVPYYITIVVVLLIQLSFLDTQLSFETIIKVFSCNATLQGGEHLWFVPTILMCYFFTPFFQKCFKSNESIYQVLLCLAILTVIAFELFIPYFNSAWIVCYLLGYVFGYQSNHKMIVEKKIFCCSLIMIAVCTNAAQVYLKYIARVGFGLRYRSMFQLFCDYAHTFLGVAIFIILRKLFGVVVDKKVFSRFLGIIRISDKYSYEWYLVHQFFILGPMSLMNLTDYLLTNIAAIVLVVCFTSYILKITVNYIEKISERVFLL